MQTRRLKYTSVLVILLFCIITCSLISLNLGVVSISPNEVFWTLLGHGTKLQNLVLFDLRLPAIVLAIIAGAGMAASGLILQSLTRNSLAEPGILGINAGAGLAVILYISATGAAMNGLAFLGVFVLPFMAFLGAMLTAVLIIVLSWKRGFHSTRLVLVGIAVNTGFNALILAIQLRMSPQDFMKAMVWLSGDLWATDWRYVLAVLPWFILLMPYILYKSHILDSLRFGKIISTGIGINVNRERILLLLVAVALSGLSVAVGGGIAFLGLISPHIAVKLVGPRHRVWLTTSMLIGSLILLMAYTLGKVILSPIEIPAGLIVALISSPYFIYLLLKSNPNSV